MSTSESLPASAPALYVDLDGTLMRSDGLWESLFGLLRESPLVLLRAPGWLLGGKARFKAEVADRAIPDPATLPYRPEIVAYVERARREGRRVVLASASERRLVDAVADHLGLFDGVIATEDGINRAGAAKLEAIRAEVGDAGFEYVGNSRADIPIWERAERVTLAAPSAAARRWAAGRDPAPEILTGHPASGWSSLLRALRPHQWAKNALLFAPLLLAHQLGDAERWLSVFTAFACFCAVASAGYLLNDLVDVEADRRHPTKHRRPIADGSLPIPRALAALAGLLVAGFAASLALLSPASTAMLAAYFGLTLWYSFQLKRQLLLDILVLAGLYTHRVLAGGVAADVPVSPWLLAFSTFLFLSLALVKRYVELLEARDVERSGLERRAYQVGDIGLVETLGASSGCISVLILCLFVSSGSVSELYASPTLLWLMCPVMLYWVCRIWFLARRGELHEDPVLFATRDRASYLCGLLVIGSVVAATLG